MAALANELKVGVGDYAISESETATTLTLYSHETRNYTTEHQCSDDLTVGSLGTVIAHTATTRYDNFDSDYSGIIGKYFKSGTSWYKIKTKPTQSATNEEVVSGESSSLVIFVSGSADSVITLTIGDEIQASNGYLVLTNKQFVDKSYNSDLTDLSGKGLLFSNKYYTITEVTKSTISTSEVVDGEITTVWMAYGPNRSTILNYSSEWSYNTKGVGYIAENISVELEDYDTSSISELGTSLVGKYINTEFTVYDEYKEKYVEYTAPAKITSYTTTKTNGVPILGLVVQEVTTVPVGSFTLTASVTEKTYSADSYLMTVPGYLITATISGYKYTFTNEDIVSLEGEKAIAVDGDELSIDTITPEIEYEYSERLNFAPSDKDGFQTSEDLIVCGYFNDDITELKYGSPLVYYNDGNCLGKFYVKNILQSKPKQYTINGMSFIGLLDKRYHKGGVYVAERFDTILGSILGDLTDITVQDEVAATVLTGYLPYDTCRNNLHQLLFATGAVILRSDDGRLIFSYLLPNANTYAINSNNIFEEGEVEYLTPCSKIELTEYAFELLDDTEVVSLFDNTEEGTVTNKKVIFGQAPVDPSTLSLSNGYVGVYFPTFLTQISTAGTYTFSYNGTSWTYNSAEIDLDTYGLSVDEDETLVSGNSITVTLGSTRTITGSTSSSSDSFSYDTTKANCNYTVVSGRGILSAKPYTQTTLVVEKDNEDAQEDYQENVVTSSDVTLISAANSDNVATRLMKYYKALRNEKITIKVTNEKCGSKYGFYNAFRRYSNGYLTKMSYRLSSFVKADCEFLTNYSPDNMGNDFSKSIILTKQDETELSGVWTSPKTGTIRAILIAGGNGGASGFAGEGSDNDGYGGEGGAAGAKGNGGKILNVTSIAVTQGQTISFHIGSGAEGGAECSSHDTNNTPVSEVSHQAGSGATTFGSYTTTSDQAYVSSTGVMDVFTGTVYALPGSSGIAGGNGGAAGSSYNKESENGDSVIYKTLTSIGGYGCNNVLASEIKEWLGESGYDYVIMATDDHWSNSATIPSTGGGGASAGNPGGNGNSARNNSVRGTYESYDGDTSGYQYCNTYTTYGLTGQGADGIARGTASTYGSGGAGGHGGGGEGGAPDTSYDTQELENTTVDGCTFKSTLYITRPSEFGTRYGKGGAGGNGADGCILLYL